MPERTRRYAVTVVWTGNEGVGTRSYRGYRRTHEIRAPGKPVLPGSADPAFRGEAGRWNPEELLVASLSACHQLWYLHLCADAGVVVTDYEDRAEGIMVEGDGGAGRFARVTLRPRVVLAAGSDAATALRLHQDAAAKCFIARSVAFPVSHEPEVAVAAD